MATQGSPLANVLKKSLTMSHQIVYEALDWNQAGKDLRKAYDDLVGVHKGIQDKLKDDWKDLAKSYDLLIAKMETLQGTKIGSSDKERKDYSDQVKAMILEAGTLKTKIEAEPARLESEANAKLIAQLKVRFDDLARNASEIGIDPIGKENAQIKTWLADGPTVKQSNRIAVVLDSGEKAVKARKVEIEKELQAKKLEEEKNAREAKEKKELEEANQKRLKEEQTAKEEALRLSALKREKEKADRKERAKPVKELLDEAIKELDAEMKAYEKLDAKITDFDGKLADKKYSVSKANLADVKKWIENDKRPLLSNKDYKAIAPSGPGFKPLADALEVTAGEFESIDLKGLETLNRELNKILANVETLTENRVKGDGYEDSVQICDPTLLEKKEKDPKVRGYVYTDELSTAEGELKDVVGILGGERRGRTSPSGAANHIHVRGNAQYNVIFDWDGDGGAVRVLGFVNGHMEKKAPPPVLAEASRVEARASGAAFTLVEVDLKERTLEVVAT